MDKPQKILLTSSRNPTPRIRAFCNDLARVMPNIECVNRGKMSMEKVAEKALERRAYNVAIVERWQGNPDRIEFFNIESVGLVPISPRLYIAHIRLQRDFVTKKLKPANSTAITKPVEADSLDLAYSLSKILDLPLLSKAEESTDYSVAIEVSHDANRRVQITFMQLPQRLEIGPRITLRRVLWETNK